MDGREIFHILMSCSAAKPMHVAKPAQQIPIVPTTASPAADSPVPTPRITTVTTPTSLDVAAPPTPTPSSTSVASPPATSTTANAKRKAPWLESLAQTKGLLDEEIKDLEKHLAHLKEKRQKIDELLTYE
ncbi:hypothetical protein DM01DRAFT_1373499 [Hesseltinella vesiculosa]|uniref:Uncharacterized protein n=1 Tax=Hesseltinella vesiculosa TaxID=101127 RepID=A0A1X2GKG2_9FUNG|nr:hypothetical protein DM01DRAFT_1373499 [Hesseltinella vesiculosa]